MPLYNTKQEVFAAVWLGLQGQQFLRSVTPHGCAYRGPNRLKCAFGHLIPDSLYFPKMEGRGVWLLHHEVPDIVEMIIPKELVDFAMELQKAHDNSVGTDHLEISLRFIAEDHDLTIPEYTHGLQS